MIDKASCSCDSDRGQSGFCWMRAAMEARRPELCNQPERALDRSLRVRESLICRAVTACTITHRKAHSLQGEGFVPEAGELWRND